jgi:hypothetical protein
MTPSSRRTETGAGTRTRPATKRVGRNSEVGGIGYGVREQRRQVNNHSGQEVDKTTAFAGRRREQAGPQPKAGRTDTR